ncbi:MAG TPA: ABC transporter ATP-binding protein [Acidimicrobiales bacterium]|nr:ABC transporter ATP-binding protein [Acidimicrobiales bacterium]
MEAIRTFALTKRYRAGRASTVGVEDLDLAVAEGQIFGYLGPNGAGKTTTIRLLLDLIRPTSGRAEVLGFDTRRDSLAIRRRVGYLPGDFAVEPGLTARQVVAHYTGLRGGAGSRRAPEIAERLDLDLDRPLRTLSKGNRQKVGLVQAFMHEPAVLVLDEPTTGLDPLVQLEFHRLVDEAVAGGSTVLLSSHVLSEVQRIATRVGILRSGHLVAVEDVDTLRARALRRIEVRFLSAVPREAFLRVDGVREIEVDGNVVRARVQGSLDALVKACARFEVDTITTEEADLEDVFLDYYREAPGDAA